MVRNKGERPFASRKKRDPFDYAVISLLAVVLVIIIFPLYYVLSLSFTSYTQYIKSSGLVLFPSPLSFDGYRQFLGNPAVLKSFFVTVFITVAGTFLNLVFTLTMAYPLSRKELPWRSFFVIFAFIPMVFNGGLIPTFYVVKQTGIMDTVWAMIFPIMVSCYNLMITRSFFQSLDDSYIEVARIEGAGELTILVKLIVPLATPVVATITLMYAVEHWNTYFHALYYVRNPDIQPLQVVLRGLLMQAQSTLEETDMSVTASAQAMKQAAVVLTALPIIIVYPFLQKYFTKGLLIGGVKG